VKNLDFSYHISFLFSRLDIYAEDDAGTNIRVKNLDFSHYILDIKIGSE